MPVDKYLDGLVELSSSGNQSPELDELYETVRDKVALPYLQHFAGEPESTDNATPTSSPDSSSYKVRLWVEAADVAAPTSPSDCSFCKVLLSLNILEKLRSVKRGGKGASTTTPRYMEGQPHECAYTHMLAKLDLRSGSSSTATSRDLIIVDSSGLIKV